MKKFGMALAVIGIFEASDVGVEKIHKSWVTENECF